MADKETVNAVCKGCGKILSPDERGTEYCSRCMIERAEEYIPQAPQRPQIKRERKSRAWMVIQVTIIVIGFAIMALQIPRLTAALKEGQPLRYGTCATDKQTDQCIQNLWHISRMLQDGKKPPPDIVCPVSKRPYEIRESGADIVIRCPNPELHGCTKLSVSTRRPVPEISK